MAESLRSLVVSLSLDSGNFTQNMKLVDTQLKTAENEFKLAQNNILGYEQTINGLNSSLSALKTKLVSQQSALTSYQSGLSRMQGVLKNDIDKMNALGESLDNAKTSGTATDEEIQKLTKSFNDQQKKVIKDGQVLEEYNKRIAETEAEIAETNHEIQETEKKLKTAKSAFTKLGEAADTASGKFKDISERSKELGQNLTRYVTSTLTALATASVKASIDFESAFASVRKTTEATEEEFEQLSESCLNMSEQVGTSASDIAEVMATGGQLGISVNQLSEFTKVMIDLGNSAEDLDADEAATTLAKFANIMNETGKEEEGYYSKMGSAIVELGNNFATTEYSISEMAMRIAGAGTQVGLTSADVLGFATAFSSLGLEAQAGGTAVSKALVKMEAAVEGTSDDSAEALKQFADIIGVTTDEFKEMWRSDNGAATVFQAFINSLAEMSEEGQSTISVLEDIGWSEVRLRDAMLRITNGHEILTDAVESANEAWDENTALTTEANKRYATTESKLNQLKQKATNFAKVFGDDVNPVIQDFISAAGDFIDKLSEMDEGERKNIETKLAVYALIGPAILAYSKLNKGLSSLLKTVSEFAKTAGSQGLLKTLTSYPALAVAAAAAIGYLGYKAYDAASGAKAAREALEDLEDTANEWSEHTAETFYNTSEGLTSFGLSKDSFKGIDSISGWINGLTTEWKDELVESDDTVNKYVESLKNMTSTTREAVQAVSDAAAENSIDVSYEQAQKDLARLDEIDAEIENFLNKKKEEMLKPDELEYLSKLLEDKSEIDSRYGVNNETSSLKALAEQVEADIAKIDATNGSNDERANKYKDALVAAAEAESAIKESIDDEYDARLKAINIIEDEEQRKKEMADLDVWYNKQLANSAQEYAGIISTYLNNVFTFGEYDETFDKLAAVYGIVNEYDSSKDGLALSEAVNSLDEDKVVELYSLMTQIEDMRSKGVDISAVLSASGIDETKYNSLWAMLEKIQGKSSLFDTDEYMSQLSSMFADLDQEVMTMTAGLDLTYAKEQWAEFAKDPGSPIFTDAIYDSAAPSDDFTAPTIDVALSDLSNDYLQNWYAVNGFNMVSGGKKLNAPVEAALGNNWAETLQNTSDEKIRLYDENGIEIPVTPEQVGQINGNDLVIGVDDDGVMHIQVVPDFVMDSGDDTNKFVDEITESTYESLSNLFNFSLTDRLINAASAYDAYREYAEASGFERMALKDYKSLKTESLLSDDEEIAAANAAAAVISAVLNGQSVDDSTISAFSYIKDIIAGISEYGDNTGLITALVNDLSKIGVIVNESELPEYLNGIYASLTTQSETFGEPISTAIESVKDAAEESVAENDFSEVGESIIDGTSDGIKEKEPEIEDVITGAVVGWVNLTQGLLGINSPSRVFKEKIGYRISEGIAAGITSGNSLVVDAIVNVAKSAVAAAKEALDIHSPSRVFRDEVGAMAAEGFGNGLTEGLASQSDVIRNASRQLTVSAAQSGVASAVNSNTYNYNTDSSISFAGANFNIRSQDDIKSLAQEIAALTKRTQRGKGVR